MAVPPKKRKSDRAQRGSRASTQSGASPAVSSANNVHLAGDAAWPYSDDTGTGRGCPPSDSVYAPGGPCGPDTSSYSGDSGSCGGGE